MVDWNKAKQVGDFKKIEVILYKKQELDDMNNSSIENGEQVDN